MRISAGLPQGVTAMLWDEVTTRRRFEAAAIEKLGSHDFSEVVLPILDYFEPYQTLLTAEMRDELYRFVDRDGELLALRRDFTPMLARLLSPRLDSLELPLRLFYRGDVVRYQEERPGRLREYYELGAELLGEPGEEAEEEMLELFAELLCSEKNGRVRIIVGLAGALDEVLLRAPADERHELARAVTRRERRRATRSSPVLLDIVENGLPDDVRALGEIADDVARVADLCGRVQARQEGDRVTLGVDLAEFAESYVAADLVSSSARRPYYDGLVFRAYFEGGAQSIGRGGRYDRLFRRLGSDLSAVGFSISVDPLLRGSAP